MNPLEALAAELMVSHCWAEDITECQEALDDYRVVNSISAESVLWFCAFSQYQARVQARSKQHFLHLFLIRTSCLDLLAI